MKKIFLIACALVTAALGSGCDDTVAQWDLYNERIIAVRASSPQLAAGERAQLELLVTSEALGPHVVAPQIAIAVPSDLQDAASAADAEVPAALARAVVADNGGWAVVAPSEAELAALRGEMQLAAGALVPLRVGVRIDLGGGPLDALKLVNLGASAVNPTLGAVTINGAPAQDGMVLPPDVDVAMSVEVAADDEVYWLSSIGDLSDEEDPAAELNHDSSNDDHLTQGHIAVVVRAKNGGVTWGFWTASIAQ